MKSSVRYTQIWIKFLTQSLKSYARKLHPLRVRTRDTTPPPGFQSGDIFWGLSAKWRLRASSGFLYPASPEIWHPTTQHLRPICRRPFFVDNTYMEIHLDQPSEVGKILPAASSKNQIYRVAVMDELQNNTSHITVCVFLSALENVLATLPAFWTI